MLRDVLEGSVEGAKVRGRPRMKMLDDIMEGIDKEEWVIEKKKKRERENEDKGRRRKAKAGEEEMNKKRRKTGTK